MYSQGLSVLSVWAGTEARPLRHPRQSAFIGGWFYAMSRTNWATMSPTSVVE